MGSGRPDTIWVRFANQAAGRRARALRPHPEAMPHLAGCTPVTAVRVETAKLTRAGGGQHFVHRWGFQLRAAEACTLHVVQGRKVEEIFIGNKEC